MKKWSMVLPLLLCMVLLVSCSKSPAIVPDNGLYRFPETREELVRQTPNIVAVKVTDTRVDKMQESNLDENKKIDTFIATAEIKETLRGDLFPGDKIQIVQEGDNQKTIYEYVIKNGGYLEKGKEYLLFLTVSPLTRTDEGHHVYIPRINGQFTLNSEDAVIFRTDMSKQYFGEFQTVGEMKEILDTLVLE